MFHCNQYFSSNNRNLLKNTSYIRTFIILFLLGIVMIVLKLKTSSTKTTMYFSSQDIDNLAFLGESPLVRLYLDIVRDTVCGLTLRTRERSLSGDSNDSQPFNIENRIRGMDWPWIGITMIGQRRLMNVEWALRTVIVNEIAGDFIECGVWRGGTSVFARAVLRALNIYDRNIWVVDSFQGLPRARTQNDGDYWSKYEYLRVSLEEVQTNFRSFNLLDEQVHFCKGYFVDSLPTCGVSQIAVLRMDGDMYESTMDQLFNLYSKVQLGGVVIIDDFNVPECVRAINDFRRWHQITDEIRSISGETSGRYWIKSTVVQLLMDEYKKLIPSNAASVAHNST